MRLLLGLISTGLLFATVAAARFGRLDKRSHVFRRARIPVWYGASACATLIATLVGDERLMECSLILLGASIVLSESLLLIHTKHLEAELRRYDGMLCPICLYPLFNNTETRCPECGCLTSVEQMRAFWYG